MGKVLEFPVTICLGGGDGGEVGIDVEVTDEEYELLLACCREDIVGIDSYEGLEDLYERVIAEARGESEFNDPDDCDIDYDDACYLVDMPYAIYEIIEAENK